ncbi:P-loop containing nucleoside triphosphate hydrolase protein [Lactarius quietus]|nr:P-loop containing nucleoside triphosphate hydrolase protein [Lactarius quietus]
MHLVYSEMVPMERRLPEDFWLPYTEEQQAIGLRASLLLWFHSGFRDLPREFQLTATIAIMSGQDSLIDVGTGAGKTLCMVLPCMISLDTLAIVFSPLKRLQAVQVLAFSRYQIKAVAINEDTPNDQNLWKDIRNGVYSVLIVQPEQLFMAKGHLPRLARLIAEDRHFSRLIQRVHVDEAHFIYTAGLKHYGLEPFRSAWGRLGEFRIKIGKQVPMQALSGTQPPHIKAAITKSLLFEESQLCSINLTSNRPNIVYATHPIVGELSDFRNLDFVVPRPYPAGWSLPKTVVFHDSVEQTSEAALYNTRRLPEDLQKKGLVMHYHGLMSKEYLTRVYEDFSNPHGQCRGLDIPDIEVVIQYGITRDVPTTLQRCGRAGRSPMGKAIFLLMYEPWVMKINCNAVEAEAVSDPDHPNVPKLTQHSKKQARTGVAMIKVVQLEQKCLRQMFAAYLNDVACDALDFTAGWCCNRHPGTNFQLRNYFKGRLLYQDPEDSRLYYGDEDDPEREEIILPTRKRQKGGVKVRATDERKMLISRLLAWRAATHLNDPLASVRPPTFIIDNRDIKIVARLHPSSITSSEQLVTVLGQTREWQNNWAHQILKVINKYDRELDDRRKEEAAQSKARQKRIKQNKDQVKFTEVTNNTEERIRQDVLRRHAAAMGKSQTSLEGGENIPIGSSSSLRIPGSK